MTDRSIQTGLEQDAQWISERIPEKMTKADIQQAVEKLRLFMERHDYIQATIARKVGVTSSVISQFLADKYKGDVRTLIIKITDLINTVDRRSRHARKREFVETNVAKRIDTVIKQTRAFSNETEGAISIIVGDSGHGKSVCLREYAAVHKNTVYIVLDNAMSATRVFSEIAAQIGIDTSGSMDNVTRRIITNLQNREVVVMIDEASALTVRQLSQLRTVIVDRCCCPLILSANSDLLKTVMLPTTRRGFESLDQFRSRLLCILNLDELAAHKGGDGGLYTAMDIRKLFEYGGVRLATNAVAALKNIASTPQSGRLRTCNRIITTLHVAKNVDKSKPIGVDQIIGAIECLGLPVKAYLPISVRQGGKEETEKEQPAKQAG